MLGVAAERSLGGRAAPQPSAAKRRAGSLKEPYEGGGSLGGSNHKTPPRKVEASTRRRAAEGSGAAPATLDHEDQSTLIDPPSRINPLESRSSPAPAAAEGATERVVAGATPPAAGRASAAGGTRRSGASSGPAASTTSLGRGAVALASLVTADIVPPSAKSSAGRSQPDAPPAEPEELETVMFGQRSLFREEDVRKAILRRLARDGEAGTTKRGSLSSGEAALGRGGSRRRGAEAAQPAAATTSSPEESGSDGGVGRIITEKTTVAARAASPAGQAGEDTPALGRRPGPRREDEPSNPTRRRVAERAPERSALAFRVEATCDCRMCGRKVTWPRKRRFRGPPWSRRGFRCDRCGNVYCAQHVLRISGWAESLIHHGRFRCHICAIGPQGS